jgi:pimeloyl-ACP methyl ester carboxylesterase
MRKECKKDEHKIVNYNIYFCFKIYGFDIHNIYKIKVCFVVIFCHSWGFRYFCCDLSIFFCIIENMLISKRPIILIPGFGGSRLVDRCKSKNITCEKRYLIPKLEQSIPKNSFIDLNVFNKDWTEKFKLKYDKEVGLLSNDSIDTYDFGGIDGIRNLCEDCTIIDNILNQFLKKEVINSIYNYRYYDVLINYLENHDYKSRKDLFGAPYDFRKIMIPEYLEMYFTKLRELIEEAYSKNNEGAILVAHSIGALVIYIFLTEYCNSDWKKKYIEKFISVAGPYGGCSVALKTLLSGLPKLTFLKDRYYEVLLYSSGLILALPNIYGYSKKEIIIYDRNNQKRYNIENFFELLPDTHYDMWSKTVKPYMGCLSKNTGVLTIFLYSGDNDTEFSYSFDTIDIKALKEPDRIIMRQGDNLVPLRSLKYHKLNYGDNPNYRFVNVRNTDHTNILHTKELIYHILH